MASIGVIEKRPHLTYTVRLHGPIIEELKPDVIQLKNLVKAMINKHSMDSGKSYIEMCDNIAYDIIDIYGNPNILWAECNIETDAGYLYHAAAERVSSYV